MANRQTRRKEQKNKKKVEEVEVVNTKTDIINKIIVALMVICILGLFYLLTIYIINKNTDTDNDTEEETTETAINYEKILIGKTFTMEDADYLVLLYDTSNADIATTYSELITNYKAKEEHLPIYYVDMSNSFNKTYSTTEESNKNPTKASELSINGPTLIRISNNLLVDYIEGEEAITNYLN